MVSASPYLCVTASAPSATPAVNSARRLIISAVSLSCAPDLLQPLIAAAIPPVELIFRRILPIEILVIVLGFVERSGRHDLRIDRLLELGLDLFLGGFRQFPFLVIVHEDRAAILLAAVAELRVLHERIDVVPEIDEQLFVSDFARVIG